MVLDLNQCWIVEKIEKGLLFHHFIEGKWFDVQITIETKQTLLFDSLQPSNSSQISNLILMLFAIEYFSKGCTKYHQFGTSCSLSKQNSAISEFFVFHEKKFKYRTFLLSPTSNSCTLHVHPKCENYIYRRFSRHFSYKP